MPEQKITIYATDWCWDCRRVRDFLDEHSIPYQWIDIDQDQSGEAYVLRANQGMRSVPTLVLQDGRVLVEPSIRILAEALQIETP